MTTRSRPDPGRDVRARGLTPIHAALLYATQGWPVLPIHTPETSGCSCGRAGCPKPGKHPRTPRGVADATTDLTRVETWWARWPDANVAIATARLVVLDIDGPAGRDALAALERAHGPLPAALFAHTAHGEHRYFSAGTHTIACSAGQLGPGLDVRGRGGYAIAPPSRHATGHTYRWASKHAIAPLPDWLAELLNTRSAHPRAPLPVPTARHSERAWRYAQAALAGELDAVRTAAVGTRNTTLNCAAFRLGQLAGADLIPADQLVDPLLDAARHAGLPRHRSAHHDRERPLRRPTPAPVQDHPLTIVSQGRSARAQDHPLTIGSQGRSARAWRVWFPVPLSIPCVRFSRTRLTDDLLGMAYAVPG